MSEVVGDKPPFTVITSRTQLKWKDVKGLVFEVLDYGNVTDWEAKKLAQKSVLLLGRKQQTSKMNLSFYSTLVSSLDFLSDDELRRLAIQCITRCTDKEENSHNITSIAHKVSVINTRYFDYKYRGKPYLPQKSVTQTEQELAMANLSRTGAQGEGDDNPTDESLDGVFDISKSLGYIPFSD